MAWDPPASSHTATAPGAWHHNPNANSLNHPTLLRPVVFRVSPVICLPSHSPTPERATPFRWLWVSWVPRVWELERNEYQTGPSTQTLGRA